MPKPDREPHVETGWAVKVQFAKVPFFVMRNGFAKKDAVSYRDVWLSRGANAKVVRVEIRELPPTPRKATRRKKG